MADEPSLEPSLGKQANKVARNRLDPLSTPGHRYRAGRSGAL